MEIHIQQQALLLAVAFALGAALGLCYDILRPFRRRSGAVGAATIDFLFALLSAVGMFVFSMSAASGRLGLWELCAALLGFLSYLFTLSDAIFPIFDRLFGFLLKIGGKTGRFVKIAAQRSAAAFCKNKACREEQTDV